MEQMHGTVWGYLRSGGLPQGGSMASGSRARLVTSVLVLIHAARRRLESCCAGVPYSCHGTTASGALVVWVGCMLAGEHVGGHGPVNRGVALLATLLLVNNSVVRVRRAGTRAVLVCYTAFGA